MMILTLVQRRPNRRVEAC